MERSVSLFLSCDVVVVRAHHARPTSRNIRERERKNRAGLIRRRERGRRRGTLLLFFFFLRSFAGTLQPDNLRPLIYATKRSRKRRDLFFFARNETCSRSSEKRIMRHTRFFWHAFSRTYDNAKDCWLVTACHDAIDPRIFHSHSATNVTVSCFLCYLH